ncbi:hypothetical protein ACIPIN_08010 [Pseudomonas sp. NPDC087697]|uniref:hypothetical protein n=1 Tax=Pseudomonas sp. NPDC087697 TaxID=3364447 RepID=UPI003824DE68
MFDRVFNQVRLFDTPLLLDGRPFSTDASDPASHTILQHLSACLGLPLTEDSLLLIVRNTQRYVGPLKCDLDTLSSIYRQARIARMFGISITDSATLTNLLGGESISRCLAKGKNSDIRTIQIEASEGDESFNLVARFHLPEQFDPNNPPLLLQGSTLILNTSRFANTNTLNEISVLFPAISSNDVQRISIGLIPTVYANLKTSLTDCPITLNGDLDALIHRESPFVKLTAQLDNRDLERVYTSVTLTQSEPQGLDTLNLLDVLMQMDWITNWLSESAYDIPKLRRLLEPMGNNDHTFQDLQRYLTKLHDDALQCVVTSAELAKLGLPKQFNWRNLLAATLLDEKGLVKDFAPAIEDDVPQQLVMALNSVIDPLLLDNDAGENSRLKDNCKRKLKDLLLLAHDRQLHLIEKFLQETSQLPMNCAKGVLSWASTSAHQILADAHSTRLSQVLHPVMRHAEAAVQLHLSNSALRLFLQHPDWLETPGTQLKLTLSCLYLLDRSNHCMTSNQHPEESLLSYLRLANSGAAVTAIQNSFLAKLLNWT